MFLTCLAQSERRKEEEPGAREPEGGGAHGQREPQRLGRVRLGQSCPGLGGLGQVTRRPGGEVTLDPTAVSELQGA